MMYISFEFLKMSKADIYFLSETAIYNATTLFRQMSLGGVVEFHLYKKTTRLAFLLTASLQSFPIYED